MEILIGVLLAIVGIPIFLLLMFAITSPTQANINNNIEKILHRVLDEREKQEEFQEYKRLQTTHIKKYKH